MSMESNIKVSVVIPVYNTEKYLARCLDSVINQTLKETEIICVNDGSTDNSLKILKEYARKDKRIKVITQENKKQGAARNAGIKTAQGKYLQFVDSDDCLFPDCLEKLLNKAQETKSDICICGLICYDEQTKEIKRDRYFTTESYSCRKHEVCDWREIKKVIFQRFEPALKFYKRDFFIENNLFYPEGIACEDVIVHVKSLIRAKRISFVDEELYCYCRNTSTSIMTALRDSREIIDAVSQYMFACLEFLQSENIYQFLKKEFLYFFMKSFSSYVEKTKNPQVRDGLKKAYEEFREKYLRKDINRKIYFRERLPFNKRNIYIFGKKIFSYTER